MPTRRTIVIARVLADRTSAMTCSSPRIRCQASALPMCRWVPDLVQSCDPCPRPQHPAAARHPRPAPLLHRARAAFRRGRLPHPRHGLLRAYGRNRPREATSRPQHSLRPNSLAIVLPDGRSPPGVRLATAHCHAWCRIPTSLRPPPRNDEGGVRARSATPCRRPSEASTRSNTSSL